MKKSIILGIGILLCNLTLLAQLEKGSMLIGGSGRFSGGINKSFSSFGFTLQPSAGYFLASKFAIGSGLGFESYVRNFKDGDSYSKRGVYLSPYARYYFLNQERKFNLLAQVGFSIGSFWSKQNNVNSSRIALTPNIKVGAVYFIRPQFALEALINISPSTNVPVFESGVQIYGSIGFQIHLNKREKSPETNL
jgi:hypothetical protein